MTAAARRQLISLLGLSGPRDQRLAPHPTPEEPSDEFPFLLHIGRTLEHWQTRARLGSLALLERRRPEAWVEINPLDAHGLGVRNDDFVRLTSRHGCVERIHARVTCVVEPGQVFVPLHFFETNVNQLTLDAFDPISREPNFKQAAVRIERVDD